MTEEEYLALDDAEETDLELWDGIARVKAVVDKEHGLLTALMSAQFYPYYRAAGGMFGPERRVRLGPGIYQKPDLALWRAGEPHGNDSLPTVAIEVRSRSETMAAQRRKCLRYIAAGVPEVWLVDPVGRTLTVFRGSEEHGPYTAADRVLLTPNLPGLEIDLVELFAALDRE